MSPLYQYTIPELIDELRKRSSALVIGLKLNEGPPVADIRIYMHCEAKNELILMGLVSLVYNDVLEGVKSQLIPPDPFSAVE